mgnify:CR=1 FL=1
MQIYSMISDIWLIYNVLYYTFHRLSSCFTAGGKTQGGKTGKSEEKARKSTGLKGWKRTGTHEWQAPGQEKTAGTEEWTVENGRNATKPTRRKPYYAELRASCL